MSNPSIPNSCSSAGTLARRRPNPDAPVVAIAEKLIIGAQDLPAEVRAVTGGKGADVVFDLVGGVMFRNAVNGLALRGRLVEIAVTGQREVSFDLADFYHNESRLFVADTLKRDLTATAEVPAGNHVGGRQARGTAWKETIAAARRRSVDLYCVA